LSATLYGEMVIDKGRCDQLQLRQLRELRLAEIAAGRTIIGPTHDSGAVVVERPSAWSTPAVVMNAIFAATGKRVTPALPLKM
jgi:CO/xanthine dehydrogenase Mo-binding subunit